MSTTQSARFLPPLRLPHHREVVGAKLVEVLHDLLALALIGKQLHWMAVGPLAHSLHLQLDELVTSWGQLADEVAERATALGVSVDGQAAGVSSGSALTPVAPTPVDGTVLLHEITHRVAEVSERARAHLVPVGDLDPVSQATLVDVVAALEKQQWLLRVQIDDHT